MDVSHELGALRFVVDSPLSSKVAMFNQQVNQHKQSQLLNPFSNTDGRSSPKPTFSKDEYGKPLAGSLTEMRGQKANMHVLKEMLELCQIIDSEGYNVKDEPTMRVIPFGELFNIYNYISDKVVGILLRARKHKLVEFEGEMLFQRRDDDVPIFLLKPINEIRHELEDKIESIKRSGSPAPQATSVLLDKKGHGLDIPKGGSPRNSVSRTPSPQVSKAATPDRETVARKPSAAIETIKTQTTDNITEVVKIENEENKIQSQSLPASCEIQSAQTAEVMENPTTNGKVSETVVPQIEFKPDVNNNNNNNNNDVPAIVIEATAVHEHPANTAETSEPNNTTTSNDPIENAASA